MRVKTDCVVVLDTMWGTEGNAPGMYRINPLNHSGKRLYRLLEGYDFWCTNSCRELVSNANKRGKPDPEWLYENLQRIDTRLILLCGNVAHSTFDRITEPIEKPHLKILHPAARTWTKLLIQIEKGNIQGKLK